MTMKSQINSFPLTALLMSLSIFLSACSSHVAPNSDDIQQAVAERGRTISNVQITQCRRYNGVDDGSDPHFDWYGCSYTATIDGKTQSQYDALVSNSGGWHTTE